MELFTANHLVTLLGFLLYNLLEMTLSDCDEIKVIFVNYFSLFNKKKSSSTKSVWENTIDPLLKFK